MTAELLDLSRLPAPNLIDVNYEADLAARKMRLRELFRIAGIPYDVQDQEHDPAIVLEEGDNQRETLVKSAFNDTYKSTLISFAKGAALDHFAANFHSMGRMPGEEDDRFRRRIQYEAENKSGGRLSGYMAECLKASIDVADVGAWVDRTDPLQPCVRLAIMIATGNGVPSNELVMLVQAHIDRKDIKQATDIVYVQPVAITETAIDVTIFHRRGPDPATLRSASGARITAMATDRRQPHRDLPLSAITAAGSVGGVEKLRINSPAADIVAGNGKLVHVTGINVASDYADD